MKMMKNHVMEWLDMKKNHGRLLYWEYRAKVKWEMRLKKLSMEAKKQTIWALMEAQREG